MIPAPVSTIMQPRVTEAGREPEEASSHLDWGAALAAPRADTATSMCGCTGICAAAAYATALAAWIFPVARRTYLMTKALELAFGAEGVADAATTFFTLPSIFWATLTTATAMRCPCSP